MILAPAGFKCESGGKTARVGRNAGVSGLAALWAMAVAASLFTSGWAAELPPEHVEFFEAKIRPILVDSCYKCHSAEAGKSKGDLLLDTRDSLRKGGASGAVIVPGDPSKSLLLEAVHYKDPDLQMPPLDDGGKLSDDQIAALEAWIKMGAPDPRTGGKPHPMDMAAARAHWAFQPVRKPAIPAVAAATARVATPVDAFILAALEAKQLSLSPTADPRTLLRRVTFDLTGLPPTPAEMTEFIADSSPAAYDRVLERLLASPQYGERWGRFWLDVARYADTKGYLAGNVERRFAFSHTYRDYVIRAFNADKPFDQFIVEQLAADQLPLGEDKSALAGLGFLTLGRRFLNNQNDIIDDRIDVVTRGLLGLTVSCARCHDHKFDPIPTKDYYSLHGIFASSEEPVEKPLLGPLVPTPEYQAFLDKTAEIQAKVDARAAQEVDTFLAGIRVKTGDYLLAAHDAAKLPETEKFEVFAGARKVNADVLKRWQVYLKERAVTHDPVLAPWFALAALPEEGFAQNARELIAQWSTASDPARPVNAAVVAAFVADEAAPPASLKDVAAIYNQVVKTVEETWVAEIAAAQKASEPKPEALPDAEREAVRQLVFAEHSPAYISPTTAADMIRRQINDKTSGLKREMEALNWTEPGAPLRAMALVDKAKPVNSKVFLRGNPANRGPEAPRRFLEVLGGETRPEFTHGSGRLELARAVVQAENPLTARVLVNRVWGWHFGEGLVRTPSDFGVRTEAPVHGELLDWLAASFVESGWSVKQLHRWIVRSATYQQTSDTQAVAAAVDPDNQLVHRFTRRRLEFEALRDTVLAVAGTLDLRSGGLPDDLAQEPFTTRRTVYGFIDRQNLPGMFRTFDYPNPDTSTAQRFATTVPQQGLFMMNSPFVQEQARRLMQRPEIKGAGADEAKIAALYRVVFQREPTADEVTLAMGFVANGRSGADDAAVPIPGGWVPGWGAFDPRSDRVRDFAALVSRRDGRVGPSETFPDPQLGHLHLTATGGHPGQGLAQAVIRRWVAPVSGTIRIEGTLQQANAGGDGVNARVVSSRRGTLGTWTVHSTKAATKLDEVTVESGETIDFVVESGASSAHDTFTWAPNVSFTAARDGAVRTWNARRDFDNPSRDRPRLTRWEELGQVLLLANELTFVD